jgi:hypothetical protein
MKMVAPTSLSTSDPVVFLPGLRGEDVVAQYWLRQVTLRMRREVCWLWRERELQHALDAADSMLPPFTDRALGSLDLVRYADDKQAFFANDVTAAHLTNSLTSPPPQSVTTRGSFAWVAQTLRLTPVECFVLAVALLPAVDSAAGSVIATCLNDPAHNHPTLALAQRLWERPDELIRCFDPAHVLLRHGLLVVQGQHDWNAVIAVPALVARELLVPGQASASLQRVTPLAEARATAAQALPPLPPVDKMQVVPVIGRAGAPLPGVAAGYAAAAGRDLVQPSPALGRDQLSSILTTAWLRGSAVYLPGELLTSSRAHDTTVDHLPLPALPLTVFVGIDDPAQLKSFGAEASAAIHVPPLSYAQRLECWRRAAPSASHATLAETARRYRYERAAIERVARQLARLNRPPTADEIHAAARADLDLGHLAQPVTPRFTLAELTLPAAQSRQIDDIVTAMKNLTRVHYEWGTARVWNEGGLALLFAGPPGTGKTMAAEAIAATLGLPLYRIDLSQVVNKYIGETEKNLRRLFDAADSADAILFFDEADSLFGKRTEVKDAHDRYANLEVSYLLERMERFKGIAILATNRKKDLDEAFLRRLRFVVQFPLPGVDERLRIWRGMIPQGVDASALDFDFLARRFSLAGGYIRSIIFHACLLSAAEGAPRTLTMPVVIRCLQREYEKLDRANSAEQFGPYASLLAAERGPA